VTEVSSLDEAIAAYRASPRDSAAILGVAEAYERAGDQAQASLWFAIAAHFAAVPAYELLQRAAEYTLKSLPPADRTAATNALRAAVQLATTALRLEPKNVAAANMQRWWQQLLTGS
jgi:hypothetical protein